MEMRQRESSGAAATASPFASGGMPHVPSSGSGNGGSSSAMGGGNSGNGGGGGGGAGSSHLGPGRKEWDAEAVAWRLARLRKGAYVHNRTGRNLAVPTKDN